MLEHGIEGNNAFAKTYMPDRNDTEDRQPIPQDKLIRLQQRCIKADDEKRWLLALISDTGMRLSEAVGLSKEDFVMDAKTPYISLKPHAWRRLKTKSSQRHIPLVGAALLASRRLLQKMIVAMPFLHTAMATSAKQIQRVPPQQMDERGNW